MGSAVDAGAAVAAHGAARRGSTMSAGRRGSGSIMTPSGNVVAYHTRTQVRQRDFLVWQELDGKR
jgi:hypothetical protein